MRENGVYAAAVLAAGLAVFSIGSEARAQSLSLPEIRDCLCLKTATDALGADLAAKRQAYDGLQAEIGQLDNQLQNERARMNVNNPADVARFRQLLERRDGLFRRSTGQAFNDLRGATDRYGARSQEYNNRCAGRPMDPGLLAQVQATLSCPPPY